MPRPKKYKTEEERLAARRKTRQLFYDRKREKDPDYFRRHMAEWRAKNPERSREIGKKHYHKYAAYYCEKKRQWHAENKERVHKYQRQYRQEHKAELLASAKRYYEENKHKICAKQRLRYQLKKQQIKSYAISGEQFTTAQLLKLRRIATAITADDI